MFPKIPQQDLRAIVTRAFEKVGILSDVHSEAEFLQDKGRVGTAPELSLPRRVQLAVVAHIRHMYTDYDKLLKQVQWNEARALVEKPSLDKLAEWRADDDDDPNAMEEILREVIVIPDDEEEETHRQTIHKAPEYADRQASVEIVASRAIAEDLETRAIDYGKDGSASRAESPESDNIEEIHFLGHGQYAFGTQDRRDQTRNQWMGAHRKRAWEQALDRHRNEPGITHSARDRLQTQQLHELTRTGTRSVNQGAIQQRTGENHRTQGQPSVYNYDDNHGLERTLILPTQISKPRAVAADGKHSVQASNTCNGAATTVRISTSSSTSTRGKGNLTKSDQIQRQQPQYLPLPLAENHASRQVETYVASPRKHYENTDGSNLFSEATRIPRETIRDPVSHVDLYEDRVSWQAVNASVKPHPEKVLQSIEGPTQLQRIAAGNQDPTTSYFTTSEPYRIRVPEYATPVSPLSPQIRKGSPGLDENLDYSKRRRAALPDGRVYERFQPHPGSNDIQRSLLVPVDQPQFSEALHRSENLQPIMMENRPVYRHQIVRPNIHNQQNSALLYVQAERAHDVAKIRPDPFHHSQVFLSNGLSYSNSRSVGSQHSPNDSFPKSLSEAYGSSDPYNHLQRGGIVSSRAAVQGPKPSAVEYTTADIERVRHGPATGQASQAIRQPIRQPLGVSSRQDTDSQIPHGQLQPVQAEQQKVRLRRRLPLERSFENTPPANDSIRYEQIVAPPSIRSQMEYHPTNAQLLEHQVLQYPKLGTNPLMGHDEDKEHERQVEYTLYNGDRPSPRFLQQDRRRYAHVCVGNSQPSVALTLTRVIMMEKPRPPAGYQYSQANPLSQTPNGMQPPMAMPKRGTHRMIDMHTGREVIVIE